MRNNFKPTSINFDSIRLLVASPGDILGWSFGEVTKPETINYRTQKPERDGLFCEKIFGPTKDINPHDSKFRGIRARDTAVDRSGNIVTKSSSRRERMGHIKLAVPVVHDWFMRVEPTPISKILGIDKLRLKKIVAYQSYVITDVDNEKVQQILVDNEAEYEAGKAAIKIRYDKAAGDKDVDVQALAEEMSRELTELTEKYENIKKTLGGLFVGALISENYYRNMDDNFIDIIEVGMGGEAIYKMLEKVNVDELIAELKEEVSSKKGAAVLKAQKRLTVVENIKKAGIEPTSFCLTVLPVIPPALRPMVQLTGGRFATSDINDLYRRVINRNNRLKKFIEKGVPEVILRNEKRILQESVNKLINNTEASSGNVVTNTTRRRSLKSLSEALSGKRGLFRQNLLGKRVDYSGRSVIVIGPELDIDECGLPKEMALELFKPFVIGKLLEWEQANNFHNAARLIEAGEPIVWDALDEAIEGKYVLLNRAPTLHRLGIQAFRPKLIEGKAIQINPLVTTGFNADFDGDQMAVHLPLSDWSQAEARDLMSAKNNLLKPADGAPTLSIYQDIVLGCYYITYEKPDAQIENPKAFTSIDEAIMAYDAGEIKLQTNIIVRYKAGIHTTNLGRLLFNEILPEDFPFVNETMTKKVINRVLAQIFNQYDNNAADESGFITADVADRLKELSLKYATKSSVSTGMDDYFEIDDLDTYVKNAESKEIKINEAFNAGQLTEIEKHNNIRKLWNDTRKEIASEFENVIEDVDTSISVLAESGARGSVANVVDVSGIIGTVDATYNVSSGSKMQAKGFDKMKIESEIELPVKGNYKNGVPPLEMFNIARNDRKGLIDTALNTAKSGYITRKLVDVAQDVFTVEDDPNEIDPGFPIYRVDEQVTTVAFKDCIYGRYLAEDVKGYGKTGELVTGEMADAIQNDESIDIVRIMSPLSTTMADGIPCRSYGIDMTTGRLISPAEPVGVIAAQSVGEPTTQLTLNNKHGAGEEDVVEGLPRLEEILEAYSIENRGRRVAILSEIAGKINIKEDGDNYIIKVTGSVEVDGEKHKEVKEYITANKPIIENGDNVKPGDRLTEGLSHIVDLMRLAGEEATKRYIVNEILRLYAGQGYNLATKHIEVIVSQMFSRVRIIEQGDSEYATGSEISRQIAKKINDKLVAAGKKPMVTETVLMGIKQVSSRSDSFLSAASFQATISELNKAAVRGAVDHLHGLKENVIIGRKIPVGTGVVPEEEFYENEFAGEPIDEIPA